MHLAVVASMPQNAAAADVERHFHSRDLIAIAAWRGSSDANGHRRMVVVDGTRGSCPADGGYALVYASRRAWADWGLARRGQMIVVWHCGTGVDCGQFPTMEQALQSLPTGAERPFECWSKSPRLS